MKCVDLRDFGRGGYRQIDDYSFGSGGMVLMAEPLQAALDAAKGDEPATVVYPTPQGALLSQEMVESLASQRHVVLICGHYEGVDERFVQKNVDLEVSLGDFVLTGGEIPAMAVIDAVSRLIPGVVGNADAVTEDSFFRGMLDHPHYTRPAEWQGMAAPEVLLSGNDAAIGEWRRGQAAARTLARRPELLSRANIQPYLRAGLYVALLHSGVKDRRGECGTAALTGLDLSDISRSCRTFGADRFFVVTPVPSQRELGRTLVRHWTEGYGSTANPDRAQAFRSLKFMPSLDRTIDWIREKRGEPPLMVGTTADMRPGSLHWMELKRRFLETERPVLLLFGTSGGLHDEVLSRCDAVMQPVTGGVGDYNHLSVRNAVAIVLDRFLGWR